MKRIAMKVQVEWSPSSGNKEADALGTDVLTNLHCRNWVKVDPSELRWEETDT